MQDRLEDVPAGRVLGRGVVVQPLARERGLIADRAQPGRQHGARLTERRVAAAVAFAVVNDTVVVRVLSGDPGRPGGATEREAREEAAELRPLVGDHPPGPMHDPEQVRRLVVGSDQDDVRPVPGGRKLRVRAGSPVCSRGQQHDGEQRQPGDRLPGEGVRSSVVCERAAAEPDPGHGSLLTKFVWSSPGECARTVRPWHPWRGRGGVGSGRASGATSSSANAWDRRGSASSATARCHYLAARTPGQPVDARSGSRVRRSRRRVPGRRARRLVELDDRVVGALEPDKTGSALKLKFTSDEGGSTFECRTSSSSRCTSSLRSGWSPRCVARLAT